MLHSVAQRSTLLLVHHVQTHDYKLLPGGQNYASTTCSGSGLVEALATQSQNQSVDKMFFCVVASCQRWRQCIDQTGE